MYITLGIEDIRKAVREYIQSCGYEVAVLKTVNQNTGTMFYWNNEGKNTDRLKVEVKLKDKER